MRLFKKSRLRFYHQINASDCGITCLRMVCSYYGRKFSTDRLAGMVDTANIGTSMALLREGATLLGFHAEGLVLQRLEDIDKLQDDLPCIVHWRGNHFVVLKKIGKRNVTIADPARGIVVMSREDFYDHCFAGNPGSRKAYVMSLQPEARFFELESDPSTFKPRMAFLQRQLAHKRIYFVVLITGLVVTMLMQFLLPFLTRNLVDGGIASGELKLVQYLLLAQLALILSKSTFEILRGWIVTHLSIRVNFSLVHSFLSKLFRLPVTFFERRKIGDLLQRVRDHQRVEVFITRYVLSFITSVLSLIVFTTVLYIYNSVFLLLFGISAILYLLWIFIFIEVRKKNDWERFETLSMNQTILTQLVSGIQDLKIYNSSEFFISKWKLNQEKYNGTLFRSLRIGQIQETGATIIFEITQLFIIYYSAKLIINNKLTLGAMLSIQFIIGQLVGPVQNIVSSILNGVEAKLSFDRIFDIWMKQEEAGLTHTVKGSQQEDIYFEEVTFKHAKLDNDFAIDKLNLHIPRGKTTAIVGPSGGGKTTILKLLMGYYTGYAGRIMIGDTDFSTINVEDWRNHIGAVLQENYIFNETIAKNIALSDEVDIARLERALKIANIYDYVCALPLKWDMMIGADGKGISQGQKQRLMIARAVYREPDLLLLDEATNALDAENELVIMSNLKQFAKGRTLVIVAHRLSTIRFADNIVVFDNGRIAESGTHDQLLENRAAYYKLIRQQLQTIEE
ncbi:ATP-binding cassette subfamily B protein [Chitinophaga dinghuensis]|uniref:ATP-binding cassette subfamily B protein n=1 Tax=Chitinophaga dinghuensis TaxID=1539050 RepID=A0A327VLN7_9BACT|nr:peptidase domain-containing ABC transporter [Chitinophaga dinghuensis]RAJ74058.1 ATP-binding cassette subfamily B protein [Chitinophaga dinghuensis]